MDFGTSPTDILNCNASLSSQQSQIAQCLERLESPAGSVSSEVSAPCSQNGGIQVSAIPTWLSNGMLGTSTSDTQSTGGALPPVSELRPGIRARGGLQLWTLSAQMAYSQSVPDSAHASALAEKHDLDSYSSPNAAYIDTTGTKTQSVGQHSQHHGYQTAAAFSYSDIQRPDLSHAESLASLESAVEQMPQTDPVLDVDSIESAYQQYLCIPLLNIPNAGVSVEQQHSLNGVANDSLFCASKSAHSIPSSLQVQTAPEQKQSSNPSNVASLLSPGDSRMSVQSTVPIQSPVSVLQKTLGFEKAVSTSGDLPSITSKPLSTAATTASNISQPVAAQVQIGGRQKQDTTKICVSKKVHSEQPVSKPAKKAFSAASLVEEVLCYRCKVCKFLHESRAELLKHAEFHHRGSAACVQRRSSFQQGPQPTANRAEKRFLCGKCRRGFFTLDECCRHLSQAHQAKSKKIRLEWIYTNQPDRMRASTPADEVADPHPQQEGTPAQQPPTPAKFGALCAAPARPKQQQQPKCPTPKRKKTGDNVVSSSQMACRRKVSQEQGSFICERKGCNVRFREVENLEYHVKCHRADTPDFACPECSVVCLRWRTMTGHLWRHHLCDMELHQCDQCDFRTYSLSKLENLHKRIHGEERPFLCDVCGKGFKTGKQLRNHKAIHRQAASGQRSATVVGPGDGSSGGSLASETCCECGRCFRGRRLLQYHRDSVHRKLRPFLCSYCGHRASSQSSLKMHLRQHTGEKPFACNLCEYRTGDHNSLRRHKMRHSGTKPYKCPHCPYACIQSSTFKSHLHRKHPGQSDSLLFACPLCSFRTVREDNYKAHLFDHSTSEAHSSHNGAPVQASAGAPLTLGDLVGFAPQSAS